MTVKTLDPHQTAAVARIVSLGRWLLLADVGTGKTVITLTAYLQMKRERRVQGAIVFAPKRVCQHVWPTECDEWNHLRGQLRVESIAGRTAGVRHDILKSTADIVCVNYELIQWLAHDYPDGVPGRDAVVFDEVDKLKSITSLRWKALRGRVPADRGWIGKAGIAWRGGMTGTPQPNHYMDLYGQVTVVDERERLAVIERGVVCRSFYDWRSCHFEGHPYRPYQYTLRAGHAKGIEQQIAPITHRIAAQPGVNAPHVRHTPARMVGLPMALQKAYRKLERDYTILLDKVVHGMATKVEVQHAGALYGKLREFGQGFLYADLSPDELLMKPRPAKVADWVSKHKHDELASLVSELQGAQAIIVYHFKAQRVRLAQQFPECGFLGVSDTEDRRTLAAWDAGTLELLAVQPQSAAHGLNLQKAAAHHIIMLTLPETAGLVTQVLGRLARRGNTAPVVYVHHIVCRDTVDEDRQGLVHGKMISQTELLARLQGRN